MSSGELHAKTLRQLQRKSADILDNSFTAAIGKK